MEEIRPTPEVPPKAEPCRHMATWVSALSDGTLRGLPRWLTRLHVSGCPRCRAAVLALGALRDEMLRLGRQPVPDQDQALTPERQAALKASLDAIDRGGQPPAAPS